jgi:signal transduction histidine kinase
MERAEALDSLSSPEADIRLRGARFFALHASAGDRKMLQYALGKETVPWIRKALERSLERAGPANAPRTEATSTVYADPPPRMMAEVRAKVIEEVAGTILHELSTIVASLKLSAPRDVGEAYGGSRTETLIDTLSSLLVGIRNLKTAASRATYAECDLSDECRKACEIFADSGDIFRFAGQAPYLVEIDPDLLKLALTNIVRNAVEAVASLPEGVERIITLNWGQAGREYWIAVIDSGVGFEREPASMVGFGKSTKGHIGFGLATAKQAMQAMEGDIYPANAAQGGARVELRWFENDEHSVD